MTTSTPVIDVTKLNKSFSGKQIIKDLSLRINKGEIFGFLGPNGSGKTTTIRMLCGLLTPDSGIGQCLGFNILTESYEIKKNIGYMTQAFSFYNDLTVIENLEFIARLYGIDSPATRIAQIMQQMGLQTRSKQLAGELSGGWKQRLALTACLLHQPQLLLLDEPTAGVDPKARRDFWDTLHELSHQGITSLVSTHFMDEAARCTRLLYLDRGQILAQGTADDVIKQIGLTTFAIKGPDLYQLQQKLLQQPAITEISVFGNTLHVSSHYQHLELTLKALLKNTDYQYQRVTDNLEDTFIYLVTQSSQQSNHGAA